MLTLSKETGQRVTYSFYLAYKHGSFREPDTGKDISKKVLREYLETPQLYREGQDLCYDLIRHSVDLKPQEILTVNPKGYLDNDPSFPDGNYLLRLENDKFVGANILYVPRNIISSCMNKLKPLHKTLWFMIIYDNSVPKGGEKYKKIIEDWTYKKKNHEKYKALETLRNLIIEKECKRYKI